MKPARAQAGEEGAARAAGCRACRCTYGCARSFLLHRSACGALGTSWGGKKSGKFADSLEDYQERYAIAKTALRVSTPSRQLKNALTSTRRSLEWAQRREAEFVADEIERARAPV